MDLTGQQKKQFGEALKSAFPSGAAFRNLALVQLNERPTMLSVAGTLDDWSVELIEWARSRGRLNELLLGARAQNPGNPELLGFFRSIGLSAAATVATARLEAIVAGNATFLNAGVWTAALEAREFQVGRVEVGGQAKGTAFLVGSDLALTNYHVVEAIVGGPAPGWNVRFDYMVANDGATVSAGLLVPFENGPNWLVDSSPYSPLDTTPIAERNGREPDIDALDFALIRLARPVGAEPRRAQSDENRSWVKVGRAEPNWRGITGIAILQHPEGRPLQLALGLPVVVTTNDPRTRARYPTPTLPGSSGSPVFDSDWNLIGLHHSGDPQRIATYNEAIPVHLIAVRAKVIAAIPQ